MERQFLNNINLFGHMETVEHDAKQLFERIGAWEAFGATGWGPPSGVIFEGQSVGNDHSTVPAAGRRIRGHDYQSTMPPIRSELESLVEEICQEDYAMPLFNLTMKKINFNETECELAYRFRELLTIKSTSRIPNQGVNQSNFSGFRKSAKPFTSSPILYPAREPMIRTWSRHYP
jgi:hypothetical protein